jgi:hypothetical protein
LTRTCACFPAAVVYGRAITSYSPVSSVFSMPDERSLRDIVREAIRNGLLPAQFPSRTLGGPGSGQACVLCGETIRYALMEVELEYARRTGGATDIERYRLHPRCCVAWENARVRFDATSDQRSP